MKKMGLFISVVVVFFSFACTKKVTEVRAPEAGTISGTALLADTSDHRSITIEIDPEDQDYTIQTNPDSSGFYSVSDLPVGRYTVTGKKYAYIPFEQTDVVVEDAETTRVDMLLTRARAQFIFDSFEAELYYYLEEEDSVYWNICNYTVRFHFENYDGVLNWFWAGVEGSPWIGGPLNFVLKAGQIDSLMKYGFGRGHADPDRVLPPDTTAVVEVRVEGLVLLHEDFDTTGAIPFEAFAYDTVTVIDGRPPDGLQFQFSDQSLYRLDK